MIHGAEEDHGSPAESARLRLANSKKDSADEHGHDDGLYERGENDLRLTELLLKVTLEKDLYLLEPGWIALEAVQLIETLVATQGQINGQRRLVADQSSVDRRLLFERDGISMVCRITSRRCDDIEQVIGRIGVQWTRKASRAVHLLDELETDEIELTIGDDYHGLLQWPLIDDTSCLE